MSRRVRPIVVDLELTPDEYGLRTGTRAPLRSDDADVRWDLSSSGGVRLPFPGGWRYLGETWQGRATLYRDERGEVLVDLDGDHEPADLGRTIDLPTLAPAGVRAWVRISLATLEVPELAIVRWRIVAGTDVLWWDGSTWTPADVDEWNSSAEVEAHFAALPISVRSWNLRANLQSFDPSALLRPEVYGARVLFSVRDRGDEDDGLVRSLVPALRGGLASTAVARSVLSASTVRLVPPPGWPYQVTGAPEAWDLTADPDEEAPLDGAWDGTGYNLAAPVASGHEVLVEWPIVPRVETSVHRDGKPESVPAIYLFPSDGGHDVWPGQGSMFVTSAQGGSPVGVELPASDLVLVRVDVRVVGELGADARRLVAELEAWARAHPVIVSPETGRLIGVRAVTPIVTTGGNLSSGVIDARGTWEIAIPSVGATGTSAVDYLRTGGLTLDLVPPEEQG